MKKCQIFTPTDNVIEMLDSVGYVDNLFGKRVLENSCGNGNILVKIVERYVEDSLRNGRNIDEIKYGLESDIFGVELDKKFYKECLDRLNETSRKFGIQNVQWNLLNNDFLKIKFDNKFEYVISNPPYIKYSNLEIKTRNFLRKTFKSCEFGKFDYCYAFIEASLNCLETGGKLSYLIPSSVYKNVFGYRLREIIKPNLLKIIDYSSIKVFEDALTASSVLICEKGNISHDFVYCNVVGKSEIRIQKNNLQDKWKFVANKPKELEVTKFGDLFRASISIATLYNKAYVIKEYTKRDKFVEVEGFEIESKVLRPGVSPRSQNYNKNELIIFPYYYKNNRLLKYKEKEFEEKYPNATKYLKTFGKELSKRDKDANNAWFEYGRSQALAHLNQPKLLLSTLVTKKVNLYELTKTSIPYSGIYITAKDGSSLDYAKEILTSDDFLDYVQEVGINASGESKRITVKDINNFVITNKTL